MAAAATSTMSYTVRGLTCGECIARMIEHLWGLPEVEGVSVDLIKDGQSVITIRSSPENWSAPGLMETSNSRKDNGFMAAPRRYPDELRDRATRMALDALADPDRAHGAIARVAEQLGVHKEALRTWVRKAQAEGVTSTSVDSDRDARLAELEKENRELRRANTILKQASLDSTRECNTISAHLMKGRIRWPQSDGQAYPKINARKSGIYGRPVLPSAKYHVKSVPRQDQSFPFSCPGEGFIFPRRNTAQALLRWQSVKRSPAV